MEFTVKVIQIILSIIIPLLIVFVSATAALKLKYAQNEEEAKFNITNIGMNILTSILLILCCSLFAMEFFSNEPLTRMSVLKMILPFVFAIILLVMMTAWKIITVFLSVMLRLKK